MKKPVQKTSLQLDVFHVGDVRKKLRQLPDNSVRCCVTSPPYYGLRDYGTGEWKGGLSECTHMPKATSGKRGLGTSTLTGGKRHSSHQLDAGRTVCLTCGAVRIDSQIGMEKTPEQYIRKLVLIFREVRRVLKDDGSLWLNLGDSYWGGKGSNGNLKARSTAKERGYKQNGGTTIDALRVLDGKHPLLKPKDMVGIPWSVALALRNDGWFLRQDIIWEKPNKMPESVRDRCTVSHEYLFLLTKRKKYYFDQEAIKVPVKESTLKDYRLSKEDANKTRVNRGYQAGTNLQRTGLVTVKNGDRLKANKRSVWTVETIPFKKAHFAVFPPKLIIDCIKAGTSEKGRCPLCGKAFTRIMQKVGEEPMRNGKNPKYRQLIIEQRGESSLNGLHGQNKINVYKTVGWLSPCSCGAEAVPDVVLDPFSGAGTTALVAKKLNRSFIGIELSAKYVNTIAIPRLQRELGVFYEPQKSILV